MERLETGKISFAHRYGRLAVSTSTSRGRTTCRTLSKSCGIPCRMEDRLLASVMPATLSGRRSGGFALASSMLLAAWHLGWSRTRFGTALAEYPKMGENVVFCTHFVALLGTFRSIVERQRQTRDHAPAVNLSIFGNTVVCLHQSKSPFPWSRLSGLVPSGLHHFGKCDRPGSFRE